MIFAWVNLYFLQYSAADGLLHICRISESSCLELPRDHLREALAVPIWRPVSPMPRPIRSRAGCRYFALNCWGAFSYFSGVLHVNMPAATFVGTASGAISTRFACLEQRSRHELCKSRVVVIYI